MADGTPAGKLVVVLAAGRTPGKRFVFEQLASMGCVVAAVDEPGAWAACLAGEGGLLTHFLTCELSARDDAAALADVLQALRTLPRPPDAVVNFAEHTALLAANVAHALGLPGSPPAAVAAARDKVMTRALAAAAGLPQPRCRRIRDSCDLAAAARHVGFPAVLKPTSGSGSQGVVRVDDEAQLALRYGEACAALRRAVVVSGALQPCAEPVAAEREPTVPAGVHDAGGGDGDEGGCEGGGGRPWACSAPPPFLLEELLVGPEVDCEVVLHRGAAAYAQVSDNWATVAPWYVDTGFTVPSALPEADHAALRAHAVAALRALGFSDGVFHVELRLTACGPRLLEVNARMAGVCVRANHCAVWGVCLVEETARAALALPPRCAAHPAPAARLSALLFNAPRSGRAGPRLAAAVGALRAHPAVLSANPMCRTGDALTGPEDGPPSWYAEVVARFDCPAEGKAWLLGVDAAWAAAGLVEPFGQP